MQGILDIRTRAGNRFPVIWLKPDREGGSDPLFTVRTYYQSPVQAEKFYTLDELLQALDKRPTP